MSDGRAPEVCVVCPTYRRADRLSRLVAALEAQTLPLDRFEVRIVDDGSHDDTDEVLKGLAERSPLQLMPMATKANAGPAGARNVGWRATSAPIVAFTDDDCVPDPGWLAAAVAALTAEGAVGVAQGRVTRDPAVHLGPWTVFREHMSPTPYFEACNVIYRRAALEQTGGFPEDVGWYGEDAEAGWRVVDAGWERSFIDGAVVAHDVEERPFRWHLRNGYLERNLVRLAARHPDFAAEAFWRPWAFQRESAAMALALAGAMGARARRPLLALALPWFWLRWPRRGYRSVPLLGPQRAALDVVKVAGHLVGSLRAGRIVL